MVSNWSIEELLEELREEKQKDTERILGEEPTKRKVAKREEHAEDKFGDIGGVCGERHKRQKRWLGMKRNRDLKQNHKELKCVKSAQEDAPERNDATHN